MKYREPRRRSVVDLQAGVDSEDVDVVVAALVDAATHEDPSWVTEELLRKAVDDRDEVRRAAVVGFGVLARRRALQSDRRVWAILFSAIDRGDDVAGIAEDVLDDLELFGTTGSAPAP